mmetsp:Transcript_9801/g.27930  ORF Transcript_9801/g.27930 Transcript_9801/m.27930 type:complete len:262 (-) Transcript_9801:959-1744(-)
MLQGDVRERGEAGGEVDGKRDLHVLGEGGGAGGEKVAGALRGARVEEDCGQGPGGRGVGGEDHRRVCGRLRGRMRRGHRGGDGRPRPVPGHVHPGLPSPAELRRGDRPLGGRRLLPDRLAPKDGVRREQGPGQEALQGDPLEHEPGVPRPGQHRLQAGTLGLPLQVPARPHRRGHRGRRDEVAREVLELQGASGGRGEEGGAVCVVGRLGAGGGFQRGLPRPGGDQEDLREAEGRLQLRAAQERLLEAEGVQPGPRLGGGP